MKKLSWVLAFVGLFACGEQRIVTEQELKDYTLDPSNGLIKQASTNGVEIEVVYRPTDLVLAQQLQGLTNENERRKEIESFSGLSYFVVKISRHGQEIENTYAGDPSKFTNVVSYLSSGLRANMYVVNGSDTIPSLDAVYTRMFGAATATSVMTIFETNVKTLTGNLKFCFDDTVLGLGRNEFVFDLADIKNAPTLNLY